MKYISLLLFSGLILSFCNSSNTKKPAVKAATGINTPPPLKNHGPHCFIYQAIAEMYLPELTN
ncbi:MAG: hypothetical protein V4456_22240 [Bacteroidota bacterium]